MNTAELIYQEVYDLPESTRLEVLGFITLAKQKLAGFKKTTINEIKSADDNSEQIYRLMCEMADEFKKNGKTIDMDEFEQSRQDRELDR